MQIVPPFVAISNSIYKLIAVFFMFLLNIQGIQRKAEAEAVFAQQLVIIKPHCARRSSEALNLTFSFVNLVSRFVTLFSLFHFIFSMFFVVFFLGFVLGRVCQVQNEVRIRWPPKIRIIRHNGLVLSPMQSL